MTTATRRRLDRLTRQAGRQRLALGATTGSGQCHDDAEHVAEVVAVLIEAGAWSVDELAARAGLSAAELQEAVRGATSAVGEW